MKWPNLQQFINSSKQLSQRMRNSIILFTALIACSYASPLIPIQEKGLTTRGETAVSVYDEELHKRWLTLFLLAASVVNSIPSGVSLFYGVYSLARSVYSIAEDCKEPSGTHDIVDCLFDALDLVLAAFMGVYKVSSGISKRDEMGLNSFAVYTSPTIASITMHAHIPIMNGTLAPASMATANNGTWGHHATVYSSDSATHHLLYRQAISSDLGFENDGSYHHYRLQPTPEFISTLQNKSSSSFSSSKREEDSAYGLVADYLWKNNQQSVWQMFHEYDGPNAGSTIANWMEENNSEATCAVPVYYLGTHGGSSTIYGDQGIIAYGWNNKPFNFNGNAGKWVGECGGPN